jgi:hypothetical protein
MKRRQSWVAGSPSRFPVAQAPLRDYHHSGCKDTDGPQAKVVEWLRVIGGAKALSQ